MKTLKCFQQEGDAYRNDNVGEPEFKTIEFDKLKLINTSTKTHYSTIKHAATAQHISKTSE